MMTAQAHAKCGCLISTYGIETWVASLVVRLLCADWDVGYRATGKVKSTLFTRVGDKGWAGFTF
jgi:hypothetical protein